LQVATTSSELGTRKSARTRRSNGSKNGNGNGNGAHRNGASSSDDDEARAASDRQLAAIAAALRSLQAGDFHVRLPVTATSPRNAAAREVALAFNDVASLLNISSREIARVSKVVGRDGEMRERAALLRDRGAGKGTPLPVSGQWATEIDAFNTLIGDLVRPSMEVARVITAVAGGDLSQKMALEIEGKPVRGEYLRIGTTVNTMVDQLRSFGSEVTRVAREVGTEGKLGGQASVPGVAGTWKDLTDSVNMMASNLTSQVRGIANVVTSVANGDLSKKFVVEAKGEIASLADTINSLTDTLRVFSDQVITVAREVGTEGKLGGQAKIPGVSGTWKDLTDSVNYMASNLTGQVRNIALVTTAVANGDLSQKITVDVEGEMLELKNTVNTMVDQLRSFAAEVTRVAKDVGTEGKLGGQAEVQGVAGTWRELTDSVNGMASNLTGQVRNIALVTTAVANGDLSQKITVDVKGEMQELKTTINTMVDQLRSFAAEVTRVAREVGTDGKLGGQADVPGVAGTWKDLTDNVNSMATNLTTQVRNIALVTTAVANGDLSRKITVDVRGEILELKDTMNIMVDQLRSFAAEVTRVAKEVGTEGRLGGQADVPGVAGTWKDLTDNVNSMAQGLTGQVRNIAQVTTAVANGDLSKKITINAEGEILELKNTINTMVDQLRSFASEVTRVAKEVGTEGKLGAQATVPGVAGTWKDLTDSVNTMAASLTDQVRNIALVTTAVANGDLSRKITVDVRGEILELKDTINTMVDQLRSFAAEVTRVAKEVGTEGKLGGQAYVPGVAGTWRDLTDNVNSMASNLTGQVRGIARVVTSVANGDLSRKFVVEAKGEIAELADTINSMTETLGIFAEQVTTVAREVGTEGRLGGQARVPGVAGTWKDLTDSVNSMASNLTTQVRGIVKVVTAVANGDLSQKLVIETKGEIAALAITINSMTDTLRVFADQVTGVAREVGIEGKLGGQAKVPGASGTWRDLTDNVNQLAGNLTAQVRAIADVATAVTEGDLTRSISVEAQGELLALKDNVNQMITNLRETTQKNQEQDWLKTNLAKFGGMMQGQKNLEAVSRLIMSQLTPLVSAHHGAFFIAEDHHDGSGRDTSLRLIASYAYKERKNVSSTFKLGEGLVGQAALEKQAILLTNVPPDYIQINSGLGEARPLNVLVLPILFEDGVRAVVELASFLPFSDIHRIFLEQLSESIGVVLNMIGANMRTEELLIQSQQLANELQTQSAELQAQQAELRRSNSELEAQAQSLKQSEELLKDQQEELQQINEELEEKATLLAEQNHAVEQKNREVETARLALEDKAEQLALSSRYKSEFLANMSHELRTPLNSLLILAKLLADNKVGNLSDKQVEYARTIQASGTDLLNLINEVLDLSKVEAGKIEIYPTDVRMDEVQDYSERSFRALAQQKGLGFDILIAPTAPVSLRTDGQRLQQILRNLLANAFKFTEAGRVELVIEPAPPLHHFQRRSLYQALAGKGVVAFRVRDTGIGIPADKHQLIFEAFQQADGTTSRRYGGTGLGLSISRELTRLLGGEIRIESEPGKGSVFTLYLPAEYSELEMTGENGAASGRSLGGRLPVPAAEDTGRALTRSSAVPDPGQVLATNELNDDRDSVTEKDRLLLVVEDDANFARVLLEMARERGFKAVVALRGDTGLALANRMHPDAILLDIGLPVVDGLTVLERLKHQPDTRHIPVHLLSGTDKRQPGLRLGAISYLEKPVSKETLDTSFKEIRRFLDERVRNLLVVEDDKVQRDSIVQLVGDDDVNSVAVGSAAEAMEKLHEMRFDCMVLDLGLPDMTGFDLLEKVKAEPELRALPIIVYTGKDLSTKEETRLKKYADAIIVKDVRSPERLLNETALFLHRVAANLPEAKRQMLDRAVAEDDTFTGKRILVVDDDVRNIFAITSVLEANGMQVVFAENGREGIEVLKANPDVSLVLMDVMMPEMDGYETMREIRKLGEYKSLPILALTAKAMKGDREKCIEAGASDYIHKPVDPDQLLSLMRVWMYH
jgi:HAMP domain-containing protein/CheY-like chemotaxis protein/signal transduction histidine kinase